MRYLLIIKQEKSDEYTAVKEVFLKWHFTFSVAYHDIFKLTFNLQAKLASVKFCTFIFEKKLKQKCKKNCMGKILCVEKTYVVELTMI